MLKTALLASTLVLAAFPALACGGHANIPCNDKIFGSHDTIAPLGWKQPKNDTIVGNHDFVAGSSDHVFGSGDTVIGNHDTIF
jgi:hypothetical protein